MTAHPPTTRRTKQREVILRILRSTDTHPTADWVYEQVRKTIPNISLGTVYRNLKFLRDAGEIIELTFGSTFSRFDGNPVGHYHFTCEHCQRVFDLPEPVHTEIDAVVAAKTGYRIKYHRLEFYGLCLDCQPPVPLS